MARHETHHRPGVDLQCHNWAAGVLTVGQHVGAMSLLPLKGAPCYGVQSWGILADVASIWAALHPDPLHIGSRPFVKPPTHDGSLSLPSSSAAS